MRYLWLAVLIALALVTAGCGRQAAEQPTIAVVPKAVSFDFWLSVKAGADKAAAEHNVKVIWKGPSDERDIAGQIAILENFINAKVDAIVMAACDSKALMTVVEKARKANIPVITIDSGVEDPTVPVVATDNKLGAQVAARTLADLTGGQGEVGLIPFVAGALTSTLRENGFKDGLRQAPGLKLVSTQYSESDTAKGMAVAEDMLTSYPKLAGIFAANEPGAIGAARAIKQRGLAGKVKLVAFDAADSEIAALREGTIQALIVQAPFKMGYQGVSLAVKALHGEQVPPVTDTGVTVVTKQNLDSADVKALLAKPK